MQPTSKRLAEWGSLGGKIRAAKLSKSRRREIALTAVRAREAKRKRNGA